MPDTDVRHVSLRDLNAPCAGKLPVLVTGCARSPQGGEIIASGWNRRFLPVEKMLNDRRRDGRGEVIDPDSGAKWAYVGRSQAAE